MIAPLLPWMLIFAAYALLWSPSARKPGAALLLAALLRFGWAHFAGGPGLMALAALAGFYGWAYHRGGLAAAVLAHLLLNTAHFARFSYPALA